MGSSVAVAGWLSAQVATLGCRVGSGGGGCHAQPRLVAAPECWRQRDHVARLCSWASSEAFSQEHPTLQRAQVTESHSGCRRLATVVASSRSERGGLYSGDTDSYVLLAPGADEEFVTAAQLRDRLVAALAPLQAEGSSGRGRGLPADLAAFRSPEAAADHLMAVACELDLGGGRGAMQWFEVRLE
eukprot:SM000184S03766  [mRNA]  locus=s184:189527:190552:+ [translate_table: standard]